MVPFGIDTPFDRRTTRRPWPLSISHVACCATLGKSSLAGAPIQLPRRECGGWRGSQGMGGAGSWRVAVR
eukprot:6216331-Pyramimonas_sp.AAC.1